MNAREVFDRQAAEIARAARAGLCAPRFRGPQTPELAVLRLRRVARGVSEPCEREAVSRFLERLTAQPDASELRDALVIMGAAAVLREERRP